MYISVRQFERASLLQVPSVWPEFYFFGTNKLYLTDFIRHVCRAFGGRASSEFGKR